MLTDLENSIYFSSQEILSSISNIEGISTDNNKNLSLDLLHRVYGEDIDIAVDLQLVADKFNIVIEQKEHTDKDSLVYFNGEQVVIEYKNHYNLTKNNIGIATSLGHIFLHMINSQGNIFFINTNSNFLAHHRSANNLNFNSKIDQFKKDAHLFGCELLVPKGALEFLFYDVSPNHKFLMSDLCDTFNVSNEIMYEVLNYYGLWNEEKIYDNYG